MKKTIKIKELENWIKEKEKDDYWTRNDDEGLLDRGKEICLDDLKEFLEDIKLGKSPTKRWRI